MQLQSDSDCYSRVASPLLLDGTYFRRSEFRLKSVFKLMSPLVKNYRYFIPSLRLRFHFVYARLRKSAAWHRRKDAKSYVPFVVLRIMMASDNMVHAHVRNLRDGARPTRCACLRSLDAAMEWRPVRAARRHRMSAACNRSCPFTALSIPAGAWLQGMSCL